MTDEELIQYCETHSQTPRARFSREHIQRIYSLAGRGQPFITSDFVDVHYDNGMKELVEEARARLRIKGWMDLGDIGDRENNLDLPDNPRIQEGPECEEETLDLSGELNG